MKTLYSIASTIAILAFSNAARAAETQKVTIKGTAQYKNDIPVAEKPISIKFKDKTFHDKTDKDGNFAVELTVPKYQRSSSKIEITTCFETIKPVLTVGPRMRDTFWVNGEGRVSLKAMKQYAKTWTLKRTGKAPETKEPEKKPEKAAEVKSDFAPEWKVIKQGPGDFVVTPKSKYKLEIKRSNSGGKYGSAGVIAKLPGEVKGRHGDSFYFDLSMKINEQSLKKLHKHGKHHTWPVHVYLLDEDKNVVADIGYTSGDTGDVSDKKVTKKKSGWDNINTPISAPASYIKVVGEGHDFDVSVRSLRTQTYFVGDDDLKWVKCYWKDKAFAIK